MFLSCFRTEVGDLQIQPRLDLAIGVLRQTDRARRRDPLEPRRNIDAVAHQIAVDSSTTSPR